jgi:hypothetical protein
MSIEKPALTNPWASGAPGNIANPGGANDTGMPYPNSKSIPGRWLNWILNKVDTATRYLMARGIPDYDPEEAYTPGDHVFDPDDSFTYECRVATTGFSPHEDINATKWILWGYTETAATELWENLFGVHFPLSFASAFASAFAAKVGVTDAQDFITIDPGYEITLNSANVVSVGGFRALLMRLSGDAESVSFPISFADSIGWARTGIVIPFVRGSGQGAVATFATLSTIMGGALQVGNMGGLGGQGSTWQLDLVVLATV